MGFDIIKYAKESFPWVAPKEGATHYAGSWSTNGPTAVSVTCPGCWEQATFDQSGDLNHWIDQHWECIRPLKLLSAGTPNWRYVISASRETIGLWDISREIDTSRETAVYPDGVGPWPVDKGLRHQEITKWIKKSNCHDRFGRPVDDDWPTLPHQYRQADIKECVRLSGNKKLRPEQLQEAWIFALVSGAKTVHRLTISHSQFLGFRAVLKDCRKAPAPECFGPFGPFGPTWAEAIDQHGMRIVPVGEKELAAFRRQAEDNLRKAGRELSLLLDALAAANKYSNRTYRLPK